MDPKLQQLMMKSLLMAVQELHILQLSVVERVNNVMDYNSDVQGVEGQSPTAFYSGQA